MKKEIDYQKEALFGCIDEGQDGLISVTNKLLNAKIKKVPEVILKAITGAGKTIIISEYIKEVYNQENKKPITFIWLSVGAGGLQKQSADKIRPLLAPYGINVHCPEEEQDFNLTRFQDKDVLVLNWEKINNSDGDELISNLMTGEKHNIKTTINNSDVDYIILIDEFHKNYKTKAYNLIVDSFNIGKRLKLILGMTATPLDEQINTRYAIHTVPTEKVREEGMIKKGTIFNEGVEDVVLNKTTGVEEEILKIAIKKRIELEEKFKNENSNITPLCLIQVPNNDKEFLDQIVKFLSEQKENGNALIEGEDYTTWFSENQDKTLIEKMNDNHIKYLFFKQAIATGWDCPRAHILVKYRRLKNKMDSFDLQTIGRVLRTPEQKTYELEDDLNYAYIYAPEKKFDFDNEVEEALGNPLAKNQKIRFPNDVIKIEKCLKTNNFKEIDITEDEAIDIFLDSLENKYKENNYDENYDRIEVFNGKLETNDQLIDGKELELGGNKHEIKFNPIQIDREFKRFLRGIKRNPHLSELNIKTILFNFFDDKIEKKISEEDETIEKIKMCLKYKGSIKRAVLSANQKIHQGAKRQKTDDTFFTFLNNPKYLVEDVTNKYKKGLYEPCIDKGFSEPEVIFIQELEKNKDVKWWYKNKDKGSKSLCVLYEIIDTIKGTRRTVIAPTYPDFIVCFEREGEISIGVYEIKDVDKVEAINDKKDLAIKKHMGQMNSEHVSRFYGGVIYIKNYKKYDQDDKIVGDINNINDYPELNKTT